MKRTQIYLDETQTSRLDEQAAAEGVSRSKVIRRAVDKYLTPSEQGQAAWQAQWLRAIGATSGIAPYLAEGEEYVEELRSADAERLTRLAS